MRSDLRDLVRLAQAGLGTGPFAAEMQIAMQPRVTDFHAGLGWTSKNDLVEAWGNADGYWTAIILVPKRKRGVIVLSNGPAIVPFAERIAASAE